MIDEGVIHFQAVHRQRPLEARRFGEAACRLIAWREILARTGLVGQQAELYGGFGYGNVSCRVGPPSAPRRRRAFLITGTQTSGKACVSLADLCVVESCDPRRNRVESHGQVLPSSESLTHGTIYDLGAHIRFVFHAHSPTIWRRAAALRIPTTDPDVPYGSPEMAREVERLWRGSSLSELRILAMGGHEDGVIAFGRTAEEAGQVTLRFLARAYEAACAEGGGLCSV
ncbi:MAG: class II aldolase/adducin family protein [bacterium]|nr:class II aldolase/adducin family protein [bacterium]